MKPAITLILLALLSSAPAQLLKATHAHPDHQGPSSALAIPPGGYTYGHTTFAIEAAPGHPVKEITGSREWSPWQTLRETRGVQFQSRYRQAGLIPFRPGKSQVQFRLLNTAAHARAVTLRNIVCQTTAGETTLVDEQFRLPAKHLHQCPPQLLDGRLNGYTYVFRVH